MNDLISRKAMKKKLIETTFPQDNMVFLNFINEQPAVDPLKTAREKIVAFEQELGVPADENYFGKGLAHGLKYCLECLDEGAKG